MNTVIQPPLVDMACYPDVEMHRAKIRQLLQHDGTPVFICERDNLVDRYQALKQSLETRWGKHVIGYSFKTNYQVARSRILQDMGAWAEVVSAREYQMARQLEYPGSSIIFNGPLKPDDSLRAAIADGALININDHDELGRFIEITSDESTRVDVGIRISSTLPRLGHSRFGFSLENDEASSAVERIRNSTGLNLVSLHSHLYGDTDDPEIYRVAARRLGEFAKSHIRDYRRALKFVDIGGGYPAHGPKPRSRSAWDPRPIDVYIKHATESLRPFFPDREACPALVVEPGRYLTCDGIILVTRVVHVKPRDEKQMVNCDGSISMVPLTHYCPQVIQAFTPDLVRRAGEEISTVIQGSTCRENDLLYEGQFPRVQPGDYLVHFAAGAYNSNLSPDFIFKSPEMAVY